MKPSLKPKKCKVCKDEFEPLRRMQTVCGLSCALAKSKKASARIALKRAREERKQLREAKEKVKTLAQWRADAQKAFNAYVRERDRDLPCISCGTFNPNIQYCAGHFLTRGAHPELAFEPLNVHKQCNRNCNLGLSGNQQEYRKGLLLRIGEEKVAWLEGPHDPKKYTIEDLKAIKAEYTRKRKELAQNPVYPVV